MATQCPPPVRYPKRPANPFSPKSSSRSSSSSNTSNISTRSSTASSSQLTPLVRPPLASLPAGMSFRRRPMLFFPNGGDFEPFEPAYPVYGQNQAQPLWYNPTRATAVAQPAHDASDTSDCGGTPRRRSHRHSSRAAVAAPADFTAVAMTTPTAQQPAQLPDATADNAQGLALSPAVSSSKSGEKTAPLRVAFRRLHKELTKVQNYYCQELAAFEGEMSAVQDFASTEVQETLWKNRVEVKGTDRLRSHGKHIEALMARVKAEHEHVVVLDNFAEARFNSVLTMLENSVQDALEHCQEARRSSLACQILVDTLARARELSDPEAAGTRDLWPMVDDGVPSRKKKKERPGDAEGWSGGDAS